MAIDIIGTYDTYLLDLIKDYLLNNKFEQVEFSFKLKNTDYYIQFSETKKRFGYIYYMDFSKECYNEEVMKNALRNISGIDIN